jgi:hypothetical protein
MKTLSAPLQYFFTLALTDSPLLRCRKRLADIMFGDESDDEAKGAKKEYTFKPKVRGRRGHRGRQQNSDEDDGDDVDGDCSESDTNSNC